MNVAQTVVVLGGSGGGGAPIVNRYAQFNGTTDYATIPAVTHTSAAGTLMVRCKLDVALPASIDQSALVEWASLGIYTSFYPYLSKCYFPIFRTTRVDAITPSASVTRTAWHWLIIRDDAANGWEALQALDNGTLYSIATAAHQAWNTSPSSRLLGRNSGGNNFDGGMDRFMVGDSRWSDAQIQAVIAGGNGPGDALVRYELNEISGGTFLDSSGNEKHATITGTPIITDF